MQESYLDPLFIRIVEYCKAPGSTVDGLVELVTVEKGNV